QSDDREPDRVRPVRRAGREEAALLRVARRDDLRVPAAAVMKPEDHPDVREAREVLQRVLQPGPQPDLAVSHLAGSRLTRRSFVDLERRPDDSDGPHDELGRHSLTW